MTAQTGIRHVIDADWIAQKREFSLRVFGPDQSTHGVLDHLRKELDEVQAAPSDLGEWADVVLLALDGAWRAGHEPQQIIDAIVAKQARNEARRWPDWRTTDPNRAIEHDRIGDECRCDPGKRMYCHVQQCRGGRDVVEP